MIKIKFIEKFKNSFIELYSIKNLTLISILTAIFIIINLFTIKISNIFYISFGFIVTALMGFFFGPFISFVFGFFSDILAYNIHPTEDFALWYAFSVAFDGLIYGIFLYKEKYSLRKIVFVQIFRDVFINILFNTICMSIQYSSSFLDLLFFIRIPKNIVKIPINCISIVFIFKFINKNFKNIK